MNYASLLKSQSEQIHNPRTTPSTEGSAISCTPNPPADGSLRAWPVRCKAGEIHRLSEAALGTLGTDPCAVKGAAVKRRGDRCAGASDRMTLRNLFFCFPCSCCEPAPGLG